MRLFFEKQAHDLKPLLWICGDIDCSCAVAKCLLPVVGLSHDLGPISKFNTVIILITRSFLFVCVNDALMSMTMDESGR